MKEQWTGIPKATEFEIRADSARPDTISYMKNHGFGRIVPATKGPDSLIDGVSFLQSYNIIVHPRCKHTIDELRHYSYKIDELTDEPTSVLADKKNHVIDSVRYALENVRKRHVAHTQAGLPI